MSHFDDRIRRDKEEVVTPAPFMGPLNSVLILWSALSRNRQVGQKRISPGRPCPATGTVGAGGWLEVAVCAVLCKLHCTHCKCLLHPQAEKKLNMQLMEMPSKPYFFNVCVLEVKTVFKILPALFRKVMHRTAMIESVSGKSYASLSRKA